MINQDRIKWFQIDKEQGNKYQHHHRPSIHFQAPDPANSHNGGGVYAKQQLHQQQQQQQQQKEQHRNRADWRHH